MTLTSASLNDSTGTKVARHEVDEPAGPGPFSFFAGDEVVISGWAFLEPAASTLNAIALETVSHATGVITRLNAQRCSRPDVAQHFGTDQLLMSGFASRLRLNHRFFGQHSVRLLQMENTRVYSSVELFTFTILSTSYETTVRGELAARFLRGAGLEVGALQRPLQVPDHCSVTYVDRMSLPDLLAHYPELQGQPVQKPDLIDDGETLSKVGTVTQDFVIANHFLEHCENPIQTIVNMSRVLKDGGILFMAVPDKRFTFDIARPVTPYAILAETFQQGHRRNRQALYTEWATYVAHARPPDVSAVARKLLDEKYSIHFNVWALPDLLEFLARCKVEFGLPMTLEWVVCSENEVILILMKRPGANQTDAR